MQLLRCLHALSALALVVALIGCGAVVDDRYERAVLPSASIEEVDDALLRTAHEPTADWLTRGRDYAETRYSPLAQIDAGNVGDLGLVWWFATGTDRGLEATPIVANGTIFTTGSWSIVYALDARTGEPDRIKGLGGGGPRGRGCVRAVVLGVPR